MRKPRPAREHGALVIADCVTSLGGVPVHVDASGIDIAYSCSQKGLSCPPGLAPFTCSERAWAKTTDRKNAVWYLDLRLLMDYFDGRKYHHTAPLSLFYAMEEGLRKIAEEGLETRFERHRRNHERLVAGLEAKGLAMHVERGKRIWTLNTVRVPAGIDDAAVRRRLLEADGIEIAGGFGPLAGKIFRIGLMGPLSTEPCVDQFLAAFARALS
jgi:alanine-glyoxylate transaminase/serine-glyoxylate transaminase/serine-pyruvate transaminase